MNIETLYTNDDFNDYLVFLAGKNYLEFDDFKQDVFLEMIESDYIKSIEDAKRVARRIRKRSKKKQIADSHYSLDNIYGYDSEDEPVSVLWEDNNILGY